MPTHRSVILAVIVGCLGVVTLAQDQPPIANWTAPPYWTPPAPAQTERLPGQMQASALALPSAPLPFVAIAPCRIVDTRVALSDGFHQPAFTDNETRTFNFPASTGCPGLPATAGAYSVNVNYHPLSQASYLTAFPTGTTMPVVATVVGYPTTWIGNAAIVPAGTGGQINVYSQFAAHVVIDINGYYGPQSVVTSLNTMTGDLTLAQGTNVTITPSGNSLTIAETGSNGAVLPAGASDQTVYSSGSGWLASSALTNDATDVGISGILNLPATTAGGTAGVVTIGGNPFIHNYGSVAAAGNTFFGVSGNFSMTGTSNTAIGAGSLKANTTGSDNTATGYLSLSANTTGSSNTATGSGSLASNTTGGGNTASGSDSLRSNTTGVNNSAFGFNSLNANTTGSENTAAGSQCLQSNTTGTDNSAVGSKSLASNTTGSYNTATGANTLAANTTGSRNVAFGSDALSASVSGDDNTASGYQSLYKNTLGASNTAIGAYSLYSNLEGNDNTAIGTFSLYFATVGVGNTAVGDSAGTSNTGSQNVFLGALAGSHETASNRLYIANMASPTLIYGRFDSHQVGINIDTSSASPALGATLDVNGNIRARTWTGSAATSVCRDVNGVLVPCSSDARLKTNIVGLAEEKDVLAVLAGLRGVAFDWDTSNPHAANAGRSREIGFIAQEVETVLPEVVHVEADGYRSMDAAKLTALLVEVAKAREARLHAQQAQIEALKAQLAERDREIERRLAAVELSK